MKKAYEQPEIQIRKYLIPSSNILTVSGDPVTNPDLGDGDDYDFFG